MLVRQVKVVEEKVEAVLLLLIMLAVGLSVVLAAEAAVDMMEDLTLVVEQVVLVVVLMVVVQVEVDLDNQPQGKAGVEVVQVDLLAPVVAALVDKVVLVATILAPWVVLVYKFIQIGEILLETNSLIEPAPGGM